MRSRERVTDESAAIACLCGTNEQYAIEAAARARSLKAAGCARVLVAGRPAALEKSLREAGVDGFIFVGCDVVATLSALLESLS
jgi:methylmalonyl-CoA mutase